MNPDTNACLTRLEKDISEQTNSYITVSRSDAETVAAYARAKIESAPQTEGVE